MDPRDDIPAWSTWPPGTRVVVRRWLSERERAESGRTVTDVIGVLVEAGPGALAVRRDTRRDESADEVVRVPADQVVAAKQVPPRPARRSPRAPSADPVVDGGTREAADPGTVTGPA